MNFEARFYFTSRNLETNFGPKLIPFFSEINILSKDNEEPKIKKLDFDRRRIRAHIVIHESMDQVSTTAL